MAEYAIMPIEDYRRACAAVRQMTGGTEDIKSGELEAQILSIETGVQLPVLVSPGAAANLLEGKQMIDQNGKVVEGSMPEVEQGKPVIRLGGETGGASGLVYVSVEQEAGYVAGGTKTATASIPTKTQPRTITPSFQRQIISCNGYMMLTNIVVEPIPEELVPDLSHVTAKAADVRAGKKIATSEGLVDGTMPDGGVTMVRLTVPDANGVFNVIVTEEMGYAAGKELTFPMRNVTYTDPDGNERTANLVNNGATSGTVDGLNTTSVEIPEGYTSGGSVTFDDTALAARIDAI